jgi:hypothetical protein
MLAQGRIQKERAITQLVSDQVEDCATIERTMKVSAGARNSFQSPLGSAFL